MIHLVYVSSASNLLKDEELLALLEKAREKNQRLGVTGMLLYKGGNFLQVLEGEEEVVMPLYEEISQDPRHHQVILVGKRQVTERMFPEWQMAFVNLQNINLEEVPGYSPYLNEPFTPENFVQHPTLAHKFLKIFKESMR